MMATHTANSQQQHSWKLIDWTKQEDGAVASTTYLEGDLSRW